MAEGEPEWFSEAVKKYFTYDAETGAILHSVNARGKARLGGVADRRTSNGYLQVKLHVGGERRAAGSHRVAWFLVTGSWPKEEIDHKDKARDNNLFSNLRECSRKQNTVRIVRSSRNLPRGVVWAGHTNKTNPYMAQMGCKYLGYHSTAESAHKAYQVEFDKQYSSEWKEF